MSKPSKNSQRRAKERSRRNATNRVRASTAGGRYWHGGWPGLEVGKVLTGRVEARAGREETFAKLSRVGIDDPTRTDRVYFTQHKDLARSFAAMAMIRDEATGTVIHHGDLYEVVPIGNVERDPDFPLGVSWCAPQARIVGSVETDINLDTYQTTRLVSPHLTWTDQSAIHNRDGSYRPSPQQRAAGFHPPLFDVLPAWTPPGHVNAWLQGSPSGDRPDPAHCRNISLRAAEAGPVLLRHIKRARALLTRGVTFTEPTLPQITSLNQFFEGRDTVEPDDGRAVVIATDRDDMIIAGLVFTLGRFGENNVTMLCDTIMVDQQWRHRGLGSVLMLTAQQLPDSPPTFAAGHCASPIGPFFAQLGYTVLAPGIPLVIPIRNNDPEVVALSGDDSSKDSWFYRQGPF